MLVKTLEFDTQFRKQIYDVFGKIHMRGSYHTKPYGSLITDIDIGNDDRTYIPNMIRILNNFPKNFRFVSFYCGINPKYKVPWKIDNNANCDYNTNKAKLWAKQLPDTEICNGVRKKLDSDMISLHDLAVIEKQLNKEDKILWTVNEIKSNKKIFDGKTYFLDKLIYAGTLTVFTFLYEFNNKFCYVDYGISLTNTETSNPSLKFLTKNYYRILKSLRVLVSRTYRDEYEQDIKNMENYLALMNQLHIVNTSGKATTDAEKKNILINCIEFGKKLPELNIENSTPSLSFATKLFGVVSEIIDNNSKELVYLYKKHLDRYAIDIDLLLYMMDESMRSIPNRVERGCPFLRMDYESIRILYIFADRIKIPYKKLFDCISGLGLDSETIRKLFTKNKFSLVPYKQTNKVGLFDDGVIYKVYKYDELDNLRKVVLLYSENEL